MFAASTSDVAHGGVPLPAVKVYEYKTTHGGQPDLVPVNAMVYDPTGGLGLEATADDVPLVSTNPPPAGDIATVVTSASVKL